MNAKRMMSLLILLTVGPCAVHGADSIVISGGRRSIIISGRDPEPSQAIVSVPSVPKPQKGSDLDSTSPVVTSPSQQDVPQAAGEVSVRLQQWGATWCPSCPGGKAQAQSAASQLGVSLEYFDYDQNRQIAQSLGVNSVPQTHIVVGGKILYRFVGQTPAGTIAAKARELSGNSGQLTQSSTVLRPMPNRYIQWPGWGTIDLETYNRNCSCSMCNSIRQQQQQYWQQLKAFQQSQTQVTPDQEGCPYVVVESMLDQMRLRSDDILGDLGCGDGRILIAAARRGIRGIGIEIDPVRADVARRNVEAAGLGHLVTIETGDAMEFDTSRCTAITAYLYPPLLAKLSPKLVGLRVVASPFHQIPGLAMSQAGDVWIHQKG